MVRDDDIKLGAYQDLTKLRHLSTPAGTKMCDLELFFSTVRFVFKQDSKGNV